MSTCFCACMCVRLCVTQKLCNCLEANATRLHLYLRLQQRARKQLNLWSRHVSPCCTFGPAPTCHSPHLFSAPAYLLSGWARAPFYSDTVVPQAHARQCLSPSLLTPSAPDPPLLAGETTTYHIERHKRVIPHFKACIIISLGLISCCARRSHHTACFSCHAIREWVHG
jgi:hypothetical protein